MADTKISALTALTGANSAPTDLLTVVDVSDTTMAASGTNKSITRQELQTYNAGTLTTDVKVLDLSATWNGGAVVFTGLNFTVTDTASAATSLLMDLKIGTASNLSVGKNLLEKKNSTNAQTFNLYNTTDGTNYERGFMRWNSNILEIGTEKGGTGTERQMALIKGTQNYLTFNGENSAARLYANGTFTVPATLHIGFTEAAYYNNIDVSIYRVGAGLLGVRNGSTGGAALNFIEQTAPAAPAANGVYIYAQDNGAGKTQLMALFASGAAQQIAIEP